MHEVALCVVDVQAGFVSERSAHIPERASTCIRLFADAGAPILVTRFVNTPGSMFRQVLNSTRVSTPKEIALHPKLILPADTAHIVDKATYSAINDETLALLRSWGTRTLAVCGIATESCVLATALDAFDLGIRPLLVADAIASHLSEELDSSARRVLSHNLGDDSLVAMAQLDARCGLS